jgi:3-hydroxypropanoate dehydrogenase
MEIDQIALKILFFEARTVRKWKDKKVDDALLKKLYDLVKLGPTSANCCPCRLFFLKSQQAKEQLKPFLDKGNVEQTMQAPVCVIVATDTQFTQEMDKLNAKMKDYFEKDEIKKKREMYRSGTLQGGYMILAARALGLDCGPMGGYDHEGVNKTFFKDGRLKVLFLCNLGYGDQTDLHPRSPRLDFDEACRIL